MEPPAGAAPARFLYKRNPQAAAWRRGGRAQALAVPSAALGTAGV
jgi:hypothetical protein